MKTTHKILTAFALIFTLVSCGNSDDLMSKETKTNTQNIIPIKLANFHAEAPDSSWILRVQFDGDLYFEDISKAIVFRGSVNELHVAQGADVVGILAKNESHILRLSIDIVECGNAGRNVDLMLRKNDKKEGTNFSGCGYYRGNPKLHNIWAVSSINGEDLNPEKFPKDIPHFEINLDTKHFSGFAGCNDVNGQLKFDYNKLIINTLISTKMYCAEVSTIENQILEILRNGPLVYTVKGRNLILENRKGTLTLKNVD